MVCYLIFHVLNAAAAFTVRRRSLLRLTGAAFYAVQAAFAVRIVAGGRYGETSAVWFAFDAAGTLFYCLLCIVSAFAFFHSKASLHDCDLRQTRTYAGLLMLLTTAIAGAYFASNLAVTWIFLEATTLCSAGIVYHRRTAQALERPQLAVFAVLQVVPAQQHLHLCGQPDALGLAHEPAPGQCARDPLALASGLPPGQTVRKDGIQHAVAPQQMAGI